MVNVNQPPSPTPTRMASPGAWSGYSPSATVPAGTVCDLIDPWLEINTQNLVWNLAQVRTQIEQRPIMAVVKCNAYGHGTVGIAQVLQRHGVQAFAVVKVHEAIALRENEIVGTILNFGPFSRHEADWIVQHDISQSVFSEAIDLLAASARKLNKQARVHIKVDTGLSRVGVPYNQALSFIERVAAMPDIAIEGIFTTLVEEPDFDGEQVERLLQVCQAAEKKGISVGIKHAASSAAVACTPAAFLDMVRPGNCLYGFEPLPPMDLRPVMSMKTRVILVKKVRPGDTIAYHRRRRVEHEMRLATLPLGYADGYPFQAINQAQVLIQGQRWPLIVYMSANHTFVDVTGAEGIKIGDEVVLFGAQGSEHISLGEVAEWGSSTVYKVGSAMSPFLPRIYIK